MTSPSPVCIATHSPPRRVGESVLGGTPSPANGSRLGIGGIDNALHSEYSGEASTLRPFGRGPTGERMSLLIRIGQTFAAFFLVNGWIAN